MIAKKVLAQINKKISKTVAHNCVVEAYANGREHGYSLYYWKDVAVSRANFRKFFGNGKNSVPLPLPKRVSFSENRNSDDIVLYFGKDCEFSMQGNVPSEKIYHQAKYFRYDKIDEVAQFVVDFFAKEK